MRSKLVTPHAAVLIWNYNDRIDSSGAKSDAHDIEQVVIGTSSIISISTTKSKSSPAGEFEIRLAPRFNWVARLTPGSWCAIIMSQSPIPTIAKDKTGKANKNSFKMLGRIDSVRGVVEVDQNTGARKTAFIITGQDWGSVFNSLVYIDPIMNNNVFLDDSIAQAQTILGVNMYSTYSKDKKMPSSADLIDSMKALWGGGATGSSITAGEAKLGTTPTTSSMILSNKTQFRLPKDVAAFMGQGAGLTASANSIIDAGTLPDLPVGTTAYNFADVIKIYHGKLEGPDTYKPLTEAYGLPNPHNFFGQHTFWQLLTELSNNALNELVTDIRWEKSGPKFALYHRIRPFVNNPAFLTRLLGAPKEKDAFQAASTIKENMSLFKDVRKTEIDLEDVININFGTNWRDKINFIEIVPTSQLLEGISSLAFESKQQGQTYDPIGYERDGFRPLKIPTAFLPYVDGATPAVRVLTYWKYLIREWHFNNHVLLNGAITFIGQDRYIQVGDNIMVDVRVLGNAPLNKYAKLSKQAYLLAHVENISHTFNVNPETGARSFATTVQFVRGVITTKSGIPLSLAECGNAIDNDATDLNDKEVRNSNTFGTSVISDPDAEKLGKNGIR